MQETQRHVARLAAQRCLRTSVMFVAMMFVCLAVLWASPADASQDYYFECPDMLTDEDMTLAELTEVLPLIVHVWGINCPHCRSHMPYTAALYGKLDLEQINFVTLCVEGSESEIEKYIDERDLGFTTLFGEGGDYSLEFEEEGWPTTFVFAPGGEYAGWCDIQGPSYISEMIALAEEAGYGSIVIEDDATEVSEDSESDDGDAVEIVRRPQGRSSTS